MFYISYHVSDIGDHFLPPDDCEWEWLCEVEGRHYARLSTDQFGSQADGIDLTVHPVDEIIDILNGNAMEVQRARAERASAFKYKMPVGDQLDAILKTFLHLRFNGIDLPQEMDDLLGQWTAIKKANSKPEFTNA